MIMLYHKTCSQSVQNNQYIKENLGNTILAIIALQDLIMFFIQNKVREFIQNKVRESLQEERGC